MYIYINKRCVRMCAYIYICIYITRIPIFLSIYLFAPICIIYIYIYTYIHIHRHIHIYMNRPQYNDPAFLGQDNICHVSESILSISDICTFNYTCMYIYLNAWGLILLSWQAHRSRLTTWLVTSGPVGLSAVRMDGCSGLRG